MPRITTKTIGVALDMHGCPNRCRHCYLGYGSNHPMSIDDLRWTGKQFRDYIKLADSNIQSLTVSSYFREPDYSDDYRYLHQISEELSDGKPERHELLSIWRLAHDPDYATWAKSVGPDSCQISFFGMEETNDWFYRRKGAFRDALTATERLLEVGMKPRWQIFLTKKLLPELKDLLKLIERLKMLPEEILAPSRKHAGKDILWRTERELCELILKDDQNQPDDEKVLSEPSQFWFLVNNNRDVYSNVGALEPWWRLGNLKADSVQTILQRFDRDEILGLNVLLHFPKSELVKLNGNQNGSKIYSGSVDLLSLYQARHCEKNWSPGKRL